MKILMRLLGAALISFPLTSAHAGGGLTMEGHLYSARISGEWSYYDVIDVLRAELFNRGWTLQDVHDVDFALRDEGKLLHNKVITVSSPDRIAGMIAKQPASSLLVTQEIVVYQDKPNTPWSYRAKPGEIVVGFVDPKVKASAMDDGDGGNAVEADAIAQELRAAVGATVAFFSEPR